MMKVYNKYIKICTYLRTLILKMNITPFPICK